jgi:hypothetical protein
MKELSDLKDIACEPLAEGTYTNCSNIDPIEIKPKDQGFDELRK